MEIHTTQFSEKIQAWLVSYLAELLEIEPSEIDVTLPFDHYGLDSATGISMMADLQEWLGYDLEPTILFDFNTIETLANHLGETNQELSKNVNESDYIEVEL